MAPSTPRLLRTLLPGLLALGRLALATPPAPPGVDPMDIQAPPPPFTDGIFPCSSCHDPKTMPPNPRRRPLEGMHADIELHHGPESRWCLDCHDLLNRDRLHLVGGEKVEFTASYLLCGQCHGDKLRDWRVGVHGKRTGSWNGPKQYFLCVHCHNPHSPRFRPLKPLPPPVPPDRIRARK
ncbi:hypothetical protein [Mesoterricola silvestris]|uniref:Cytochrome c7-like domain-containing protein n=1 Tax=Mesoterricola silvestris TaxID=2927979 RepID=A0AA48K8B9_9BACT|nr:hypothetical protein [Mesoterricola silvestris]BDU71975.1 hypothetical protein METEAL_11490 [Mesoterricola silvestris]